MLNEFQEESNESNWKRAEESCKNLHELRKRLLSRNRIYVVPHEKRNGETTGKLSLSSTTKTPFTTAENYSFHTQKSLLTPPSTRVSKVSSLNPTNPKEPDQVGNSIQVKTCRKLIGTLNSGLDSHSLNLWNCPSTYATGTVKRRPQTNNYSTPKLGIPIPIPTTSRTPSQENWSQNSNNPKFYTKESRDSSSNVFTPTIPQLEQVDVNSERVMGSVLARPKERTIGRSKNESTRNSSSSRFLRKPKISGIKEDPVKRPVELRITNVGIGTLNGIPGFPYANDDSNDKTFSGSQPRSLGGRREFEKTFDISHSQIECDRERDGDSSGSRNCDSVPSSATVREKDEPSSPRQRLDSQDGSGDDEEPDTTTTKPRLILIPSQTDATNQARRGPILLRPDPDFLFKTISSASLPTLVQLSDRHHVDRFTFPTQPSSAPSTTPNTWSSLNEQLDSTSFHQDQIRFRYENSLGKNYRIMTLLPQPRTSVRVQSERSLDSSREPEGADPSSLMKGKAEGEQETPIQVHDPPSPVFLLNGTPTQMKYMKKVREVFFSSFDPKACLCCGDVAFHNNN